MNLGVYYETVAVCDADGSGCLDTGNCLAQCGLNCDLGDQYVWE